MGEIAVLDVFRYASAPAIQLAERLAAPPLVIERDEIDRMIDVFDRSLTEVERELGHD
jgi:4-aminobutyrate aminotransferase-like enzyme